MNQLERLFSSWHFRKTIFWRGIVFFFQKLPVPSRTREDYGGEYMKTTFSKSFKRLNLGKLTVTNDITGKSSLNKWKFFKSAKYFFLKIMNIKLTIFHLKEISSKNLGRFWGFLVLLCCYLRKRFHLKLYIFLLTFSNHFTLKLIIT